jgi:23S rRNA pseudouridine1911/1915/1917 synthase
VGQPQGDGRQHAEPGALLHVQVTAALAGERLDKLLVRASAQQRAEHSEVEPAPALGRAALKQLFSSGKVWLLGRDGRRRLATKGQIAAEGDTVLVCRSLDELELGMDHAAAPDREAVLHVVLETAWLVVVDKPAGQPSAPLDPGELGTVANALLARYPEMASVGFSAREPGLCHRLDNDTSGLLLAARQAGAFATLTAAIRAGRLHKRYLLVCPSSGLPVRGSIDFPLTPHPRDSRRVLACVHPRDRSRHAARDATTSYRVLLRSGESALCEVRAPRALRHQIRAHFAAIGHPIHGDRLYGSTIALDLGRHALHASSMAFAGEPPIDGFRLHSPLPPELRALVGTTMPRRAEPGADQSPVDEGDGAS